MRRKVKFLANQVELVILKAIIRSWHHSWGYAMISMFGFLLALIGAVAAVWFLSGAIAALLRDDAQLVMEHFFMVLVMTIVSLVCFKMARQILPVDVRDAYVGGDDDDDNL